MIRRPSEIAGDAMITWIGKVPLSEPIARAPVAEFERNALTLPAPPAAPAIVSVAPAGSDYVTLSWTAVEGADEYVIDVFRVTSIASHWYYARTVGAPATSLDLYVPSDTQAFRVRAVGKGGGSDPVIAKVSTRKRGVRGG